MPLKIVGHLTNTKVEYDRPILQATVARPTRREALAALLRLRDVFSGTGVPDDEFHLACDVLHRYILTR